LPINARTSGAMYIVLYTDEDLITSEIYKICRLKENEKSKEEVFPRVCSKEDIKLLGYENPNHSSYLLYHIKKIETEEFKNMKWDITKLNSFDNNNKFSPLVVSLAELMKTDSPD